MTNVRNDSRARGVSSGCRNHSAMSGAQKYNIIYMAMLHSTLNQNTALKSRWVASLFWLSAEIKPLSCNALAMREKMVSIPTMP